MLWIVRYFCLNVIFGSIEPFVLLTANVEDIKQIAKKFLSDSLSEQISEFISKAKVRDNLSEENERNAKDCTNSGEMVQSQQYKYDGQKPEIYYDKRPDEQTERSDRYSQLIFEKKYLKYDKNNLEKQARNPAYSMRDKAVEVEKANRFQYENNMKNEFQPTNNAYGGREKPINMENPRFQAVPTYQLRDKQLELEKPSRFQIKPKQRQVLLNDDNEELQFFKRAPTTGAMRNEFDQYDQYKKVQAH